MINVKPFTGSPGEWDATVRRSSGWSHFHLYGWRHVMERVFNHACVYLGAYEGETLVGVLPLVRVKSAIFGHYLVSMPFLNYGGPLGSEAAVVALAQYAEEQARRDKVKLMELRSRTQLPIALPASTRKVTVVLDLPANTDKLFKSFEAKLRSQVRRPQKEGVTMRFGLDQVAPFFGIFAHHMRDLGTPTQPKRLFEVIAETFPEDVWFGCAYIGDVPIACGCGFRWGDEFEMTWASALAAHKKLSANMLLYWSFMERAVQEGVKVFNFGRCTPGAGTHKFKRQWGDARDEQLWWYDWSPTQGTTTPSPDAGAYAWGPRIWRHLPVPLATALGPKVVRYIP